MRERLKRWGLGIVDRIVPFFGAGRLGFSPENKVVKPVDRYLKGFSRSALIAGCVFDALCSVWLWKSARDVATYRA